MCWCGACWFLAFTVLRDIHSTVGSCQYRFTLFKFQGRLSHFLSVVCRSSWRVMTTLKPQMEWEKQVERWDGINTEFRNSRKSYRAAHTTVENGKCFANLRNDEQRLRDFHFKLCFFSWNVKCRIRTCWMLCYDQNEIKTSSYIWVQHSTFKRV